MRCTTASILALATAASAKTIDIVAGQNGLTYTPDTATAAVGDVIAFHFGSKFHDVVQGDFDNACQPVKQGGFYSGFFQDATVQNIKTFSVTVNSTDPIYFYCSFEGHCQAGMVGVINPPSSGNTQAAYAAAAGKTQDSSAPANVSGGSVSNGLGAGSSSSAAGPSATTSGGTGTVSSTGVSAGAPSATGSVKPSAGTNVKASAGVVGLVAAAGVALAVL